MPDNTIQTMNDIIDDDGNSLYGPQDLIMVAEKLARKEPYDAPRP